MMHDLGCASLIEQVLPCTCNAPVLDDVKWRCDCTFCPCNIPLEKRGRICPDCKAGRHMSWQTGEIIDKDDPI